MFPGIPSEIVISNGQATAIAGGHLSFGDLGPRTTKRVSHVEFYEAINLWQVFPSPSRPDGAALASFATYDEAIAWEVEYFNQQLAQSGTVPN